MIHPNIATALGEAMTHADNITAAELAKYLDVSRQTVYDWLAGNYKPTGKHREHIENVLKCTIADRGVSLEYKN